MAVLNTRLAEITTLFSVSKITGWHVFSAHGVLRMDAGRAVIIAFTMPLWANILSTLLLKERLTSSRILALGVGLGEILALVLVVAALSIALFFQKSN